MTEIWNLRDAVENRLRERLGPQRARGVLVLNVEGHVQVGCPTPLVAMLAKRVLKTTFKVRRAPHSFALLDVFGVRVCQPEGQR